MITNSNKFAYLKKAADIATLAMEDVRKWITTNKTELEVKNHLVRFMFKHGANGLSFDPIIAFGKNGAEPHHKPNSTKLKNNQLVTIDIGCKYKGYCSDLTRTFFVGTKPTKEQKAIFNLIYKAQKLGLAKAKVGIKACNLDSIVRNYISKNSKRWGKLFIHGLGHGVGKQIHEEPYIKQKNESKLKNNDVITIEPGVYEVGFGGVRIEDTIVITNKGIINLTNKARKDFKQ